MTVRVREMVDEERQLLKALDQLSETPPALPDLAEIERGAFLWLVQEAWRVGARRDGRKGHLKDEEIAQRIHEQTRGEIAEDYDRNQFQLEFGRGKLQANGQVYHKPITRPVARAFLEIALNHWDITVRNPEPRDQIWSLCTPFAGLKPADINGIVEAAVGAMFADIRPGYPRETVLCRKSTGLGPNALCRDLGRSGLSLMVVARGEGVRLDHPDSEILELAHLLNLLLEQGRGPSSGSLHIWALEYPGAATFSEVIPKVRRIEHLRYILRVIKRLNDAAGDHTDWRCVPLERCVVAVRKEEAEPSDLFLPETPNEWVKQGVPADARRFLPVFAYNKGDEPRFFNFPSGPDSSLTPFIEVGDPKNRMREELIALHEAAQALCASEDIPSSNKNWRLYKAAQFISEEQS